MLRSPPGTSLEVAAREELDELLGDGTLRRRPGRPRPGVDLQLRQRIGVGAVEGRARV